MLFAVFVEGAIHDGRAQPRVRQREHPVKVALRKGWAEFFAAPGADRSAALKCKRHVCAKLCSQGQQP